MRNLSEYSEKINYQIKGLPFSEKELSLDDIPAKGWNILKGNMPMPLATIKASVIESNSKWMRNFTKKYRAHIAPHGKTSMSPQLFKRQIDDGAWAITVANIHQLRLCIRWGIKRVFLANQVAGVQNLKELTNELALEPDLDFFILIDSIENAKQLADAAKKQKLNNPIQILIELGFQGGRTGCRSFRSALNLARSVQSLKPYLELKGVEGYEALLRTYPNPENKIRNFLIELKKLFTTCIDENLFQKKPFIISAGGSDFFDLVLQNFSEISSKQDVCCVIRSGCYLTHDSLNYKRVFENIKKRSPEVEELDFSLKPALQVWGVVQSVPEPGLCIINLGKRDVSYDLDLPIPELLFCPSMHKTPLTISNEFRVKGLNDQHTFLEIPKLKKLCIGDYLAFGISHPCTTFDKWRLVYLIDDNYNIIGGIRTYLS